MLLQRKPKEVLEEFLIAYSSIQKIDIDKARAIILNATKKHSANKDENSYLQEMQTKWYDSLKAGKPDYSLYDEDYYFTDLWVCWVVYSRKYLNGLLRNVSISHSANIITILKGTTSVLDLGCGIGFTTASLKQIFPNAEVFGTNIEETKQFAFCKLMSEKYNFKIVSDISKINHNIDLVFASEYFEHIENPIEHLNDVIASLRPKYLIIASAFNTRALGHFIEYKDNGNIIPQEKISKLFNSVLVYNGYKKLKTNLWNNRPTIWEKI